MRPTAGAVVTTLPLPNVVSPLRGYFIWGGVTGGYASLPPSVSVSPLRGSSFVIACHLSFVIAASGGSSLFHYRPRRLAFQPLSFSASQPAACRPSFLLTGEDCYGKVCLHKPRFGKWLFAKRSFAEC